VLADAGREDWILCQITSKPYGDTKAILLQDGGFESGSLRVDSYVRPGKLFTAHQTLMVSETGRLKEATFQQIVDAIVALLKPVTKQPEEASPTA
jgi:mRNA interferase MazF